MQNFPIISSWIDDVTQWMQHDLVDLSVKLLYFIPPFHSTKIHSTKALCLDNISMNKWGLYVYMWRDISYISYIYINGQ